VQAIRYRATEVKRPLTPDEVVQIYKSHQ